MPAGRLQSGDGVGGAGSGLWPCSSTVDVRRWCGSGVHTRFASFLGSTLTSRCCRERYGRAPVTRAPTGNGTGRHKPERVPHGRHVSCQARPGWQLGALRGDGSATGNTPRGNASPALPAASGARGRPLPVASASRSAGPGGRKRNEEAEARPFRHCSAAPNETAPRPFRNGRRERGLFRRARGTAAPDRSAVSEQPPGTAGILRCEQGRHRSPPVLVRTSNPSRRECRSHDQRRTARPGPRRPPW